MCWMTVCLEGRYRGSDRSDGRLFPLGWRRPSRGCVGGREGGQEREPGLRLGVLRAWRCGQCEVVARQLEVRERRVAL